MKVFGYFLAHRPFIYILKTVIITSMSSIFQQYLITFGWAITGAISMGVSLGIVVKIFSWITPIQEWKEIEKGNLAMGMILASVVLGSALVIGLTVMP